MKAFLAPLVAASLLSTSVASAAAPLPASPARDAAPIDRASEMGSSWAIVAVIAVAVGILFFVVLDDDDEPTSP